MKFTLSRPIAQGPRVLTEIEFVEPTSRDLVKLSKQGPQGPFDTALSVMSMLTRLDPRFLETHLSARDFFELSEASARFFEAMEEA